MTDTLCDIESKITEKESDRDSLNCDWYGNKELAVISDLHDLSFFIAIRSLKEVFQEFLKINYKFSLIIWKNVFSFEVLLIKMC